MVINLKGELTDWLASPQAQGLLRQLLREVVREELQSLLLDDLVDVGEAASILKISETAVYKKAERGQLPSVKVGRWVRFRRADLLKGCS